MAGRHLKRVDWNQHKSEITTLYITDGKSLQEVQRILRERHGFDASLGIYRKKLKEWGLWRSINRTILEFASQYGPLPSSTTIGETALSFGNKSPNVDSTPLRDDRIAGLTLEQMPLLQDDEAQLPSTQRSQPTPVDANDFPTHSSRQYELTAAASAFVAPYPTEFSTLRFLELPQEDISIDDDPQIIDESQSQIGMVRGSGTASLVVHLKYGHQGISRDIQRILSTRPLPVKEFRRSEAVRNQSNEKLSSRNESDMDVSKDTHTGHLKTFSSDITSMNVGVQSVRVEPRAVIRNSLEGVDEGVKKGLGDGLRKRFRQKEKHELLDTSTIISRDSGYVSRMSSSTRAPPNYLPKDWDLGSVISLESRATDVTMSSINPTALGGAAEEVVEVLVQKVEVRDLIVKGFQTMDIDRFERNFRRLLKEFAINLRKEAQSEAQKSATKLVHDYRAYVTRIIRGKFAIDHSLTQAEALHGIQKQQASKVMLERLLCNIAETSEPGAEEAAVESDYGSGSSDDEQPALPNLEKVKDFMMSSVAFFELERRLHEFVNPKPTFVAFVEGLRNSDNANNASPEDSHKQLPLPAEQLSTVTFNGPNLSNLDVNMSDVCEARLTSPMDGFNSDHPMSVSVNLRPQTKDEHHRAHKDAGDGGSITPSKRAWDPNDDVGPPPKRQSTAKSSVETQHPVYSSTTEVPINIFSADVDIGMEGAPYVPELMSPSCMGSVEDSYEVHEVHLMASQDQAEQEAGSRVLKDGIHVNFGLTREQRGFTPSQTMQTTLSEQATPPEQGVACQMIGPRDTIGAGAEWEDVKSQGSPLVQVLRVTNDISPESIIAASAAMNRPRNFERARAEKGDLRALTKDKVLPSTPRLGREGREESAFECQSVNQKTLFPDQQGGAVDVISAALYQQQTSRLAENMRANQGIFLKIKNMGRRLTRPKALPGRERLEWKCGCGEDLFTDLSSASTEEIRRLSAILHCAGSQSSHTGGPCVVNSFSNIQRPQLAQISSRTPSSSSTQSSWSSSSTLLGSVSSSTTNIISHPSNQAYLEVCINTGEYTKTLSEINLKDVGCDGELFKRIRSEYSRLRSFRSRFWLLKPSGVHFVKFAVQDPLRVGILQKPLSIPPQSEVDAKKYLYSPCPLQDDPPMPQDIFLHYLSCTSFDPKPAWLPRLPKKIDSSILRFTGAINEGWGIHIKEGPNWFAVGMINVCLMITSGVAAGLWKYFMNDFQGAFGFAGWIVAVVNAVLVAYIAKWSQS